MDTYFIGYDSREHEAACVCAHSLLMRATRPSQVYFVEHRALRRLGLFNREWTIEASGQYRDNLDTRPFSTEFSHSRFLVFRLAKELGLEGPCMFVDCDWLFLQDPAKLMEAQKLKPKRLGIVSRRRKVEEGSTKMDGMVQENYERKLWSAMFTFMPHHKWTALFGPEFVNTATGRDLHNFRGLGDHEFWRIDPRWHYIPSLDERKNDPYGIHFSEFSPWLNPEKYDTAPEEFKAWEAAYTDWLKYSWISGNTSVASGLEGAVLAART